MRSTRSGIASLCVGACLLGNAAPAASQDTTKLWHDPYTASNTLGYRLDATFADMLQRCGIGRLQEKLHWWQSKRALSSIPSTMQQKDMMRPIVALPSAYTMNVLRYAFDDTSVVGYVDLDDRRRIDEAAFTSVITPETGGNNSSGWAYAQTCASVLAAAADLSLTAPVANFGAALKKEFSSRQRVVLLGGAFRSPLTVALSTPVNSAQERLALLAIYRLYTGNSSLDQHQPRYITSFQGVSLIDLGEVENATSVSFDANASGNFIVGGAKGSIKIGNNQTNTARIWKYETYVYTDTACGKKGCIIFDTLPSRADIVRRLAAQSIQYDGPTLRFVRNAINPVPVTYAAAGIPDAFCGGWVTDQSTTSNAAVTLLDQKKGQEPNTCVFTFSVAPTRAAAAKSGQLLEVVHALRSSTRFADAERPVLKFVARFIPTDDPRLIVGRFNPVGVPIPSMDPAASPLGFSWDIPVTFVDGNAPVDFTAAATTDSTNLNCGGRNQPLNPIGAVAGSAADNLFRLRVERPLRGSEIVAEGPRPALCTLSGWLVVALQPRAGMPTPSARRWIETTVLLPPVNEKPPPAAGAGGSN